MDCWKSVKTILDKFDNDKDAALDFEEFREMCIALFDREQIENSESVVQDIFYIFDTDDDHHLNENELNRCYTDWISVILNPRNVLIVVDVQNDFIDGSLALKNCAAGDDGAEVVKPINKLIQEGNWKKVIYSLDWHPPNHIGFYENLNLRPLHVDSKVKKEDAKVFDTVLFEVPYLEQRLWPVHCVANTWGAQLHKDLIIAKNSEQILKGQNPEMETYSVFFDNNSVNSTELVDKLKEIDATDIYVCGLAYDVCVKATCVDGLRLGYRLVLIEDCCRGVDSTSVIESKKTIQNDFGLIATSEEALKLANGQTRNLVMAQQAAAVLAKRYAEKIEI